MSVAIIGIVGVPACYGGFETLVDNLLDEDGEFLVYCSSKTYSEMPLEYKGAQLKYLPFNANGASSIIYDAVAMLHAIFTGKRVLLILGVSACFLLPLIRAFTKRKLIVNIDGLEWRRNKWSRIARCYLKISEWFAVRFSHVVIADNKGIADYVLEEYKVDARTVAYGGDHVLVSKSSGVMKDYAFSLCRIEPENNVHMILESFAQSGVNIKFVGNWEASDYGVSLKEKFSAYANIELVDPVYDLMTLFKYRDESLFYVHGHSAGGTNPSLVEAMFFGKQILAFDCVYNRATLHNEGLYFKSVESLIGCMADRANESWLVDGENIRKLATREYRWEKIRHAYMAML